MRPVAVPIRRMLSALYALSTTLEQPTTNLTTHAAWTISYLNQAVLAAMGGHQLFGTRFTTPQALIRRAGELQATSVVTSPVGLAYLMRAVESGLRLPEELAMVTTGGETLSPVLASRFERQTGRFVVNGYGMAEAGGVLLVGDGKCERLNPLNDDVTITGREDGGVVLSAGLGTPVPTGDILAADGDGVRFEGRKVDRELGRTPDLLKLENEILGSAPVKDVVVWGGDLPVVGFVPSTRDVTEADHAIRARAAERGVGKIKTSPVVTVMRTKGGEKILRSQFASLVPRP